jgi:hypothetical protein
MKILSKSAAKILDTLTAGLAFGEARKIDNSRAFMAVHVDRIGKNTFAVSHYYRQNGDSMADPDVEFVRIEATVRGRKIQAWVPTAIQQDGIRNSYRRVVQHHDGEITGISREQHGLATFCNQWMRNIKDQQGDLSPKAPEPEPAPAAEENLRCIYCGAPSVSCWCGNCDKGARAGGTAEPSGPQMRQLALF